MKYPILIPSKGRYENTYTADWLDTYQIDYKLVIEPQDTANYLTRFSYEKLVVMPYNNQGIAYVRNFCKEYARKNGHQYHWQIDDDIRYFHERIDGRNVQTNPVRGFNFIAREVDKYSNIGGASFCHSAFAFGFKKDVLINKMIYCVMLLNSDVKKSFKHGTSEDVDYSAGMLQEGWCTLLYTRHLLQAHTAKKTGGLDYGNNVRKNRNLQLQADWPGWFIEYEKSPGESRIKPSRIWRAYTHQPVLKGKSPVIIPDLFS